MNETLKQRIVGATVITALAAIFVPMLFDNPVPDADNYTNELSLPKEPDNGMQDLLDTIPKNQQAVLSRPIPAKIKIQAETIVQSAKDSDLKSWVIQVGSFSHKQNAQDFRDKLRKNKFTAYVDSITNSKGITLYRLRVGPEIDKARAVKAQQQLEALYKVKTMLVSE